MKKAILCAIALTLILTCSTAGAIKGASNCTYEYIESGTATFVLYENARIIGALSPDEDTPTVAIQHACTASPAWIQSQQALRVHCWAKVRLDEELRIVEGGTKLNITILLTDRAAVEAIAGELTVENIIDATVYSPNLCAGTPKAAHMFLKPLNRERQVGVIIFASGAELALWMGDFDGDGERDLGFVALVREVEKPKPAETPKPTATPCQQTQGKSCCRKTVSISLQVCVKVCVSVNVGIGGCCK